MCRAASVKPALREPFLGLVREHYIDFGPSLAAEYLTQRHGFAHSIETPRRWLIEAGLWKSKRVRPRTVYSARERRSARGKLVQIDGSPHGWFEARADKCCLIAFIDDATSQVINARFYPVESTAAYRNTCPAVWRRVCADSTAPRFSHLLSASSNIGGLTVAMGNFPMWGKRSFSISRSHIAAYMSVHASALVSRNSRATGSKVFAAAVAVACLSSRFAAPWSLPSASNSRAASHRFLAFSSDTAG